jgi:hypothetical protein
MQGRYRENIGKFYGELPVDSLKKACALGEIEGELKSSIPLSSPSNSPQEVISLPIT